MKAPLLVAAKPNMDEVLLNYDSLERYLLTAKYTHLNQRRKIDKCIGINLQFNTVTAFLRNVAFLRHQT